MAELRDYVTRRLRKVTRKFLECKVGLRQTYDKKTPRPRLYEEETERRAQKRTKMVKHEKK